MKGVNNILREKIKTQNFYLCIFSSSVGVFKVFFSYKEYFLYLLKSLNIHIKSFKKFKSSWLLSHRIIVMLFEVEYIQPLKENIVKFDHCNFIPPPPPHPHSMKSTLKIHYRLENYIGIAQEINRFKLFK